MSADDKHNRYNPAKIEPKWQQVWRETELYKTEEDPSKEKFYALVFFPYPSGDLHIGHWYNFGIGDAVARHGRMQGKRVLHPIGFDAFGLPAENAAIRNKIDPAVWTRKNIETMTDQLRQIGAMYDLDKTLSTADPEYYRWTQWLFLEMFRKGMAYQAEGLVNWCEHDQTVLANEQVVDGKCERCGHPVIRRNLKQWYWKITDYAEELLKDLDNLDWPVKVKTMQRNWIGRSEGAEIEFEVEGKGHVTVFTTRIDTIYGATYLVLAPEHPMVEGITTPEHREALTRYQTKASAESEIERQNTEKEKSGVFTGAYATNPATGEKIPIWVSDYVLLSYGTGAIMAVPAHDRRDWDFAQKYDLSVTEVLETPDGEEKPFTGQSKAINSDSHTGKTSEQASKSILEELTKKGSAKQSTSYRLHDWLVSRQRYWGAPIPIIYCQKCGTVPVSDGELPVRLPEGVEFMPTGESPLKKLDSFRKTKCPKCGGEAERETDTLDTFVDSSWYYLRYPNPAYDEGPFDPQGIKEWLPVDQYMGGVEHAILHLLYSRFVTKFLRDQGHIEFGEPFPRLYNQGHILGPDGHKMSKSRGNVVNPDDYVTKYGADAVRMYLMFMGPWDQGGVWDVNGPLGTFRFLSRLYQLVGEVEGAPGKGKPVEDHEEALEIAGLARATDRLIAKVSGELEKFRFNLAVASFMEYLNTITEIRRKFPIEDAKNEWATELRRVSTVLAPLAPHIAEELWRMLGGSESVHLQTWPSVDPLALQDEIIVIAVQVNGKLRAQIPASRGATEEELVNEALKLESVTKWLTDSAPKKIIYVQDRLLSLVA